MSRNPAARSAMNRAFTALLVSICTVAVAPLAAAALGNGAARAMPD